MTENTSSSEITPLSGEQLNDLVASFDASQSNRLAMNAVTAAAVLTPSRFITDVRYKNDSRTMLS